MCKWPNTLLCCLIMLEVKVGQPLLSRCIDTALFCPFCLWQSIQRRLEEIEVTFRDLEQKGIALERSLRGDARKNPAPPFLLYPLLSYMFRQATFCSLFLRGGRCISSLWEAEAIFPRCFDRFYLTMQVFA